MLKTIKFLILTYPQQVLIFLLNSSLFIWIRVSLAQLSHQTGLDNLYQLYAPTWLQGLTDNSFERFLAFMETSSWAWLVASLILIMVWRWLSRLLRTLFLLALLAFALWFIWQNQAWLA
ncbi:hypothetical protein [Streptococcus merionis]|uniref:hypothetical protein n=1 Tax=Streptococcus merionis TaxID=400065 RepID=UPI00036FB38E|nr:hypothetical protein [Streptococcus merionis]